VAAVKDHTYVEDEPGQCRCGLPRRNYRAHPGEKPQDVAEAVQLEVGRTGWSHPATAVQAGRAAAPRAGTDKHHIMRVLSRRPRFAPGATCDQLEEILVRPHQTISARVGELVADGLLREARDPETGRTLTRDTRQGHKATVYVLTAAALELGFAPCGAVS
jgi:hypothetical protein